MKNKSLTYTLLGIGAFLGATALASAKTAPKPRYHLTFAQADVDGNGGLSVFEFAHTKGPGTPLVEIRKRFLPIDVSTAQVIDPATGLPTVDPVTGEPVPPEPVPDGLVTQEELSAYYALAVKPKSTLGRFDLADFDGDGQLTAVELGYLVSPKVKASNIRRKFKKLDRNHDGFVSRTEFRKVKSVL